MVDDNDRQARIVALSSRAEAKRRGENKNTKENEESKNNSQQQHTSTLTFRNHSLSQQQQQHDNNTRESIESNNSKKKQKTGEKKNVKSELELALMEAKRQLAMSKNNINSNNDNNLDKLHAKATSAYAPKKVNWDLKRDIESRINRLERKTQKAIVELLRERLEREACQDADELD